MRATKDFENFLLDSRCYLLTKFEFMINLKAAKADRRDDSAECVGKCGRIGSLNDIAFWIARI